MLINLIVWIILGGIAGWLASLIMGKDASMGTIANIIVGIVGAVIGGDTHGCRRKDLGHQAPVHHRGAHALIHRRGHRHYTGISTSQIIAELAGWTTLVSPLSILLAFGFSGLVGISFGFYPAYTASLLDPIEELRYE